MVLSTRIHSHRRTHADFSIRKVIHKGKKEVPVPRCAQKSQLHYWKVEGWRAEGLFSTHLCQETLKNSSAHLPNVSTQI